MERPLNVRTKTTRFSRSALVSLTLGGAPALWTQQAAAHIRMSEPVARNVWAARPFDDPIKQAPCGSGQNDPRSTDPAKINTFAPGETITVSWEETVQHPGFYRISIDMDGQDDFVSPTSLADVQDPPVLPVLMDGIPDKDNGTYSVEVTLPNETCDNCTLQLIQFMSESEENYFVCADLVIEGDVIGGDGDGDGTGGAPDSTTDGDGAGGTLDSTASGGQGTGGTTSAGGESGGSVSTSTGGQVTGIGGGLTTGDTGSEVPGPSGDDEVESSGCSVSSTLPNTGSAIAWIMGLVGLSAMSARRRLRR